MDIPAWKERRNLKPKRVNACTKYVEFSKAFSSSLLSEGVVDSNPTQYICLACAN